MKELRTLDTTYRDSIAYNLQQLIAGAPQYEPVVWANACFQRLLKAANKDKSRKCGVALTHRLYLIQE